MSRLERHGTVSGPSGHTHSNSYAMKGVRLKYKPGIYVPDLLQLPPGWTKPTLPSEQAFSYDYSLEHRIAEQARQRALSIASEASLQRRQVMALQQIQKQQQETSDGLSGVASTTSQGSPPARKQSVPIYPFMSGTEILTPTPVAQVSSSNTTPANAGKGEAVRTGVNGPGATSQSNSDGSSSSLLSDDDSKKGAAGAGKEAAVVKSLGDFSLKEFEGDSTDPFEMAALQAINDMEELQSVLQPLVGTGPSTGYSNNAPPTSNYTLTSSNSSCVPGPPITSAMFSIAMPSPPVPVTVVSPLSSNFVVPSASASGLPANTCAQLPSNPATSTSHSSMASKSSPDLRSAVVQPVQITENRHLEIAVSSGPVGQIQRQPFHQNTQQPVASSGSSFVGKVSPTPVSTQASLASTNLYSGSNALSSKPFQSSNVADDSHSVSYPYIPLTNDDEEELQQDQPHPSFPHQVQSAPTIATLVDIGSSDSKTPPIPAPRSSPKLMNKESPSQARATSTASSSASSSPLPVPRPRPRGGSPSPSGTPPSSSGVKVLPPPPSPRTSPSVAHHSRTAPVPPSQTSATGSASTATKNWITGQGGVAVLPPAPSKVLVPTTESEDLPPPPAYKAVSTPPTTRKGSPPPPYSSPVTNHRTQPVAVAPSPPAYRPPPRVAPKPYALPNPESNLSAAEKEQVKTIEAMGFPQPRVARAVLRYKGDQIKVLDFLFLVGELEEARYNGDSAEVALTACEENVDKAKEYLQKLETYKEFGFHEKAIHEAYAKAKANWDEALNILTKDR